MAIFGLDFGTTNSVVTFINQPTAAEPPNPLVILSREDGRPHPSVVWYAGAEPVVGRAAKSRLGDLGLGVFGDIVRSPKGFLGSGIPIPVSGANLSAVDVVADILRFLRRDAHLRYSNQPFEQAVFTIPVSMQGRARSELRQAAFKAGLHIHQFIHEPLAALYGHLRGQRNFQQRLAALDGKLVLVFDWGGGTLDLTLCKFWRGTLLQVLNLGDPGVGGDQFDLRLVNFVRDKHSAAHPNADWALISESAQARLIQACEDAKIDLSTNQEHDVFVPSVLASPGPERDLRVQITRQDLRNVTNDLVNTGLKAVDRLLSAAGIPSHAVEFCLATGGMAAVPMIRQGLLEIFGIARLHDPNNPATVISEGAAWVAHDGLRLRLAKSMDILQGGDDHVAFIRAGTELPTAGQQISKSLALFSVDPRDGVAKFQFSRAKWPGRDSARDERLTYTILTVDIDPHAAPLEERLTVEAQIDHDLIAKISACSTLRGDFSETEIHDLEFGLGVWREPAAGENSRARGNPAPTSAHREPGAVRVRSNLTTVPDDWDEVPGEIVRNFRVSHALTAKQRREDGYYKPCAICGRSAYVIARDGCDECDKTLSTAEARARRTQSAPATAHCSAPLWTPGS